MGGLLGEGGQSVCCPLSNYWAGGGLAPWPLPFLTPMILKLDVFDLAFRAVEKVLHA